MIHNLSKYVGIPFIDKGRDFTGVDCYGLVCLVYNELFQIVLPSLSVSGDDNDAISKVIENYHQSWNSVDRPTFGDIILFRGSAPGGYRIHVALCADGRRMLHAQYGDSSRIEYFDSVGWRSKVQGYYQHIGRDW